MKDLVQQSFAGSDLNLFFLLLFVAVFTGIVAFALRPGKKEDYERAANLPFQD